MSAFATAQSVQFDSRVIPFQGRTQVNSVSMAKSITSCGQDTVDYTFEKATGLRGINLNNATSATALSQYFNAPQAITIHGASFYAYKINATGGISIPVTVSIFNAGPDSLPTGTALATTTVTVDTSFGGGSLTVLQKRANFATPVTTTQAYVVVISNANANGVALIVNDYIAADGDGEWLSSAQLGASFVRSYNVVLGGNAFNGDALVSPHVTYSLNADFTSNPTFLCAPGTVNFTDASSPIILNRMYSVDAFYAQTNFDYFYNFGDGTTAYGPNQSHTYATPPPFTVILTDSLFGWRRTCVARDTIVLSNAIPSSVTSTNATCTGGTGTATISPTGATPYTYNWSNGANGATASNLVAGNYTVTATDANGCIARNTVTVNSTTIVITTNTPTTTNSACGGTTGTASVNPSNGTAPYTYAWSNSGNTQTISNIAAGSYSVTITDANGCVGNVSGIVVNNPNSPTINVSANNVSCNGQATGSATAVGTGGTAPYTYTWSNSAIGGTINNIAAGTYSVTVTDNASCLAVSSVTVTQPTAIVVANNTTTNVSCFGGNNGSAAVAATGGTGAYTFLWSNAGTSATITGLTAGTYTATVTDANGCNNAASVTITQPATALGLSAAGTDISCNGSIDGTGAATATGGTAPYSYTWSNGATSAAASNLSAGVYTVTTTDANGCVANASDITVTEPTAINSSTTVTDCSVFGATDGNVALAAGGGTGAYTFLWSNGATTQNLANVASGTYTVSVTDANGCTDVATAIVDQPSSVGVNNANINISVFPNPADASATLSISLVNTSDVNVQVINTLGQVLTSISDASVINNQYTLNTSEWAAGVYVVRVAAGNDVATYRLTKK